MYDGLTQTGTPKAVAILVGLFLLCIGLAIAFIKVAEMSFVQIVFSWLRTLLNGKARQWEK